MYVCVCIYLNVHIHIYIYTHMYTHVQSEHVCAPSLVLDSSLVPHQGASSGRASQSCWCPVPRPPALGLSSASNPCLVLQPARKQEGLTQLTVVPYEDLELVKTRSVSSLALPGRGFHEARGPQVGEGPSQAHRANVAEDGALSLGASWKYMRE